ncbi:nicotinate-nucleotide adenylyltransferase [Virgibacillus subterraneus]|uniref:Probable nicotinate-nucleotide adenylyltransferase n=1 Tax=Virgibacillus subterraneus TaxID=621109 RepID=A0A1H9DTK2_9BACI|nr:nicotinate-nucleotide adenylyltransferase [Virgibacillus subterraneus]SEQ16796.1 nicotinate-nucleotide adenylyltransferase [Virgibacillus subterraneus]
MKYIGILGGTFDPPHLGHLIIAEEVRVALKLDEVWFIPSQEPPHKKKAFIGATHRVEMVKRAIDSNPNFKLSTIEVDRLGKSFTFNTMKLLTKDNPNVVFHFIIGADMVEYLPNWKNIDELLNMVKFVGVKRQGYKLNSEYPIIEVDVPLIEISSTKIKERLTNNKSVRYRLPGSVEDYIKEKQLYEKRGCD